MSWAVRGYYRLVGQINLTMPPEDHHGAIGIEWRQIVE